MSVDLKYIIPEKGENNKWFVFNESQTVFVFVHGILSDSQSCWMYKNKKDTKDNVYWPQLIMEDDRFDNVSIYLGGYYTGIDSGSYEIGDCSREIYDALNRDDRRFQRAVMSKKNIIFICHSTGGIVVRDLLTKQYESFAEKRVGLILLASPSYGSKVVNKLDLLVKFYKNELGKKLKWGSWALKDLDDRFKTVLHENRIPNLEGIEACENHFLIHRRWLPNTNVVVNKESAGRYFGPPILLRKTDHFSISKPNIFNHPTHEMLIDFYSKHFLTLNENFTQKQIADSINIREKEIYELSVLLKNAMNNYSCLWITGQPGIGKTYFAFQIMQTLYNDRRYVYIPDGAESDETKFIETIKESLPDEFFEALMKNSFDPLMAAIMAFKDSNVVMIVESANDPELINERQNIIGTLIDSVDRERNIRLIFTAYSAEKKKRNNHLSFNLLELSLSDTKKIVESYHKNVTKQICEQIYNRYEGHTLSIFSWAKTLTNDVDNFSIGDIPLETVELYKKIWERTPSEGKKIFILLCHEPDLAIISLHDKQDIDILLKNGLLSCYPNTKTNGVLYYIHQIPRKVCLEDTPYAAILTALICKLSNINYEDASLSHNPINLRLTKYLLKNGELNKASNIILQKGRDWLESCGLRTTHDFIINAKLKYKSETTEATFCHYLEGLSYLFNGEYLKAKVHYESKLNTVYDLDSLKAEYLVNVFEIIECLRRSREFPKAIQLFSENYKLLRNYKLNNDLLESYYIGVSYFIAGNLFRHFSNYSNAYISYSKAEQCFQKSLSSNDRIELLHCLYAKSQCFLNSDQSKYDLVSFDSLIEDTNSLFVKGLFCLTKARYKVLNNELETADDDIVNAQECFKKFGSIIYYQRSCCLEALLYMLKGEIEAALKAIHKTSLKHKSSPKVIILENTIYRMLNKDLTDHFIEDSVRKLLDYGDSISALSLSALCNAHGTTLNNVKTDKLKQLYLFSDQNDNWSLKEKQYDSLYQFSEEMAVQYNIDNHKSFIILYD